MASKLSEIFEEDGVSGLIEFAEHHDKVSHAERQNTSPFRNLRPNPSTHRSIGFQTRQVARAIINNE